jgi:elongation factor G
VVNYLPTPSEKVNKGFILENNVEKPILFETTSKKPFIGYAFKLEENKFG